ncbi:glucose PTS transporter subunit EIIB [Erwinia sp. AnSW2-5]|uniref:glucose PTS transporter subunit EIIB n=1 Tax=Erwinia sp. AnSW2-5 TaxID=3367692 RepID=UPI003859BF38
MVSLKSFKHYFSRQETPEEADAAECALLDQLMGCFGGRENIVQVDACLTRLRVTVTSVAAVNASGLQQAGATGVVILGHEVHAIFGMRSDRLRQLMEAHYFRQP